MKRGIAIFIFLIISLSFISSQVIVHNSANITVKDAYAYGETLEGELNVTITNEPFNAKITSSEDDEIGLEEFLDSNGITYTCSPIDCSMDYEQTASIDNNPFQVSKNEDYFAGFKITGNNVEIVSLNFDLLSNFATSTQRQLELELFENQLWNFNEFSSSEFSSRLYGCYQDKNPQAKVTIATSSYCELIPFLETGSIKTGARVNNGDTKKLTMSLYTESGSFIDSCDFNPSSGEQDCEIKAEEGESFSAGNYHVCVGASSSDGPTNYKLYEEVSGQHCGFVLGNSPSTATKDYAIFASLAKFDSAASLSTETLDFELAAAAADALIEERYGRDCSNDCLLPIKISGVDQTLQFQNISIQYNKDGENYIENDLFKLTSTPATASFSGILDLGLTGFEITKEGVYRLFLGEEELFEDEFTLLPAPKINSISPTNPPAGVPIKLFVSVEAGKNQSLEYSWDLGDGTLKTTNENFVSHTFDEIKNYTVTVEVSSGLDYGSSKEFIIQTSSPETAIVVGLAQKKSALNRINGIIGTIPAWYNSIIRSAIEPSVSEKEIEKLEKEKALAITGAEFLEIAKKLYALVVPANIFIEEKRGYGLVAELKDIDPNVVATFAGGSTDGAEEEYKDAIVRWQNQNIESSIISSRYIVQYDNLETKDILIAYQVSVTSHDDAESYLVINKPSIDLFFKDSIKTSKVENTTILTIDSNGQKNFEFYVLGNEEPTMFVSPRISSLVIEKTIDETCNFNLICEEDLGETYKTCRSDCKPFWRAGVYFIIALFGVLILYTFLQIWYQRHYEKFLFGDRKHLYNLLMYVTNARARGLSDERIKSDLKRQGWNSERINYVIRKSRGQRTGLPEIIPLSKIGAARRKKKVQNQNYTTPSRQQMGRNINKSGPQGNVQGRGFRP